PFRARKVAEVRRQVAGQEPVAPRSRNVRLPRDLETICLKCLRKEPAQRYGSAAEVTDDLERWLRGEPIAARPGGRGERVVKWVRRSPAAAGLLAAFALVSVLVPVACFAAYLDDEQRTALAEGQTKAAQAEAAAKQQALGEAEQALTE